MNNKTLGIVFGALLVIYLMTKFFGGPKDRSFDPNILQLDTATVTKIQIRPSGGEPSFSLDRSGGSWSLQREGETYDLAMGSVGTLLSNIQLIKAERVVSKNVDRFSEYNVDDSTGTVIEIYSSGKKIKEMVAGRFSFNQATRNGISYVRLADDEAVYAVDGFLSMTLTQSFDNYRDKSILKLNKTDLTKVSFEDGISNREVRKEGNIWMRDQTVVDSTAMASYLSNISSVSGSAFLDDESKIGQKIKEVTFEGNNMNGPVTITCYVAEGATQPFVLNSSMNADAYFLSDTMGVHDRLFGKLSEIFN